MPPKTKAASSKKKASASSTSASKRAKESHKKASKKNASNAARKSKKKGSSDAPPKQKKSKEEIRKLLRHEMYYTKARWDKTAETLPEHCPETSRYNVKFALGSEANLTWGTVEDGVQVAPRRTRLSGGIAEMRKRKEKGLPYYQPRNVDAMDIDTTDDENEAEETRIDTKKPCYLMLLPAEIRRKIFSYLLIQPRPILLHTNWTSIRPSNTSERLQTAILACNRQLKDEGTKFMYIMNHFQSLVRENMAGFNPAKRIKEQYVEYYKKLIMQIEDDSYSTDDALLTSLAIKRLVDAGPTASTNLNWLVLSFYPKQLRATTTFLGLESNPIAHADWFTEQSCLFKQLIRLQCKTLYIVARVPIRGLGVDGVLTANELYPRFSQYIRHSDFTVATYNGQTIPMEKMLRMGANLGNGRRLPAKRLVLRIDTSKMLCNIPSEQFRPESIERILKEAKAAKGQILGVKKWLEDVVENWHKVVHTREDTIVLGTGEEYADMGRVFEERKKNGTWAAWKARAEKEGEAMRGISGGEAGGEGDGDGGEGEESSDGNSD